MSNLRYGLKEVANVVLYDVTTDTPVLFFDTLKVSTIENSSESAEARGGQGNNKLMSWDFGRTATLTMQDALLSDLSLSLLSGNEVKTENVTIANREVLTVGADGEVTLSQVPTGKITLFSTSGGKMIEQVIFTTPEAGGKTITVTDSKVEAGSQVMAFYNYVKATEASVVTFSGNAFPATYKVVGDTIVRGEDGVDRKMQFVIPKAKLQSNFSLTMEAENVSTFDFTLDVLVDSATNKLYDIIRVN